MKEQKERRDRKDARHDRSERRAGKHLPDLPDGQAAAHEIAGAVVLEETHGQIQQPIPYRGLNPGLHPPFHALHRYAGRQRDEEADQVRGEEQRRHLIKLRDAALRE